MVSLRKLLSLGACEAVATMAELTVLDLWDCMDYYAELCRSEGFYQWKTFACDVKCVGHRQHLSPVKP